MARGLLCEQVMNKPMNLNGHLGTRGPDGAGAQPAERFLVASANPLMRDLAAVILKRHGLKVVTANCLGHAIEMTRVERFVAIIADPWPESAGGDCLRELVHATNGAKLTLLVDGDHQAGAARAAGADATLSCRLEESEIRKFLEQLRGHLVGGSAGLLKEA
jgi:CheY-like chemotaxis protein